MIGRIALMSGDLGHLNGLPVGVIIRTTLQDLESRAGIGVTGGGSKIPIADVIKMAAHANHHLAIFDGATEVDMVINIGALKSGDVRTVQLDIDAVADACRAAGVVSKVIIETALLTDEEKVTACTLAKAAGATFVKTSTGFARGGATPADVALMRPVVGAAMGVKAAGGVRDLEGLKAMVEAGASRVGASAGVKIVQQSAGKTVSAAAPSGY